jgi:hypothetical protein
VYSENTLFCALRHWVAYDTLRKSHFLELVSLLNLSTVSRSYLLDVVEPELQKLGNEATSFMIIQVKNYLLCSPRRQYLVGVLPKDVRRAIQRTKSPQFFWNITVEDLQKSGVAISSTFFMDGYFFYLKARKIGLYCTLPCHFLKLRKSMNL